MVRQLSRLACVSAIYAAPTAAASKLDAISADDLMPVLSYVLAQCSVGGDLGICAEWIQKLADPPLLMGGQTGYYFTTFCSALNFLAREKAVGSDEPAEPEPPPEAEGYKVGEEVEVFSRSNDEWFRGKEVLDIGCNAGQLTAAIAARFGCARVVGIDIDANLVSKARQLVFLTLTLTPTSTLIRCSTTAQR